MVASFPDIREDLGTLHGEDFDVTQPQLLGIAMPVSDRVEIYSGVARMAGKLWASLHRAPSSSRTVVVVVHPSSNFLGHYLLAPLAAAGIDAVGLNTRYIGNDSALTLESCVVDVGAAVPAAASAN